MPYRSKPPVTLHIGAHRTATSSLQRLLMRSEDALRADRIAVWAPGQTRAGLLSGVLGDPGLASRRRDLMAHRAAGRVSMLRDDLARAGIRRLILSEENALGGLRENVLLGRLYPTVGPRLQRLGRAVPGIDRVCLAIRSPDEWWTSAFAFLMTRGFAPPDMATRDVVLKARRTWRDVICDVATVFPGATISVWTYEGTGRAPAKAYQSLTGLRAECDVVRPVNQRLSLSALQQRLTDEGSMIRLPGVADVYAPFTPDERAALRKRYAEDLAWLRDGADGLAEFVTNDATDWPTDGPAWDRKGVTDVARRDTESQMGWTG